jgi:multidrug efflux pump subunit AcrA (membrane-fusion protein)
VLAVALWLAQPLVAHADTISPRDYRQRLTDARALVVQARALNGANRDAAVTRARLVLLATTAIALPAGELAINDGALAERIVSSDAALDAAVALLDAQLALVSRAVSPSLDAAQSDAALRDVLRAVENSQVSPSFIDAVIRALQRFLAGLEGPRVDFGLVWPLLGILGAAIIFFVVATLGRGLGERVRTEVALREAAGADRADPARHLRAADEALAAGRPRDAIHALYLFALTSLVAREAIRFDPALTDRELLVRAAAIPHADALRDLVALYERSWFGLRDPGTDEAHRARTLAMRVAG